MVFGLVGNVLGAEVRGLAIGANISPIETEVPGMAWPHPIVSVATELAYTLRRGIDQAHIADFHLFDELELESAIEAMDSAAMARVFLAGRDQGFIIGFYGIDALFTRE